MSERRLHIGGESPRDGWEILNVQAGPDVDHVGSCTDLSRFADGSITEIYASHVLEHLTYADELPRALRECRRVLIADGRLMISVPDLETLAATYVKPGISADSRLQIMRVMFGGQTDAYDLHKCGFSYDTLCLFLAQAGFREAAQVERFGLFPDSSELKIDGRYLSLNVVATV
ncbi:MAG: methyltransferase domain-containing protein [Rhodospirillales bacterium]